MNYCQDGVQVYFITEPQSYRPIYGHYERQPNDVNGKPYFKMGFFGLWWVGAFWVIGYDGVKGNMQGIAIYPKDVFCPHQLSGWEWITIISETSISYEGKSLGLTCK